MPPLTLDRNAHFLRNAYTLAHLAEAAYADDPAADPAFNRTIFADGEAAEPVLFSDADSDTQGFVCGDADHVVVAFRGTEPQILRDWLTDLNFKMIKQPEIGGRVHAGFEFALDSVWNQVIQGIRKLAAQDQTLWITGHSLGGALATLMARWLLAAKRPYSVATFGQPRVGDLAFAKEYRRHHFRFVNNRDIVPTVPPRVFPGSLFPPAFYTHVGDLQFFDKGGELVAKNVAGELGVFPDLVSSLGPLARSEAEAASLVLGGLEDHKMKNYLRCLKDNLP